MPGRTRRVRLIAVVLCIVTVFFLYERNAAQVDEYADYFTKNTVGGGAVIRKPDEQEPFPEAEPVRRPQVEPVPSTTSRRYARPDQTTTAEPYVPSSSTWSSSQHFAATTTSTSSRRVLLVGDGSDFNLNAPYVDAEDAEDMEDAYDPYAPSITESQPHWTKLPLKFPVTSTIQLPTGSPMAIPLVQKQGKGKGTADKVRLAQVRKACKHAWTGFRTQGWDYDEVRPLSGGGTNSFNGWGATLVDSLDTLWIMGLKEEFEEGVNKTAEIDFTTSSRGDIPLFEVTIRYLGGLLGAYDVSGRKYRVLLDKAVELGEVLYSAFDTPNRMPETYYEWRPEYAINKHRASSRAVMAELGTLSLEFTRLAQLTGEPKYYDAIARVTNEFQIWQNKTRIPGMWPTDMDASGCKKPVYQSPTSTYKQLPVPDSEHRLTSEPVKVDANVLSKAEHTVNELADQRKIDDGPSLRHSMEDDPWMKPSNPALYAEDTTNQQSANQPLPPGAGAPKSGSTLENTAFGSRPADPVPPNASGSSHNVKRQLDSMDAVPGHLNNTLLSLHQGLKKEVVASPAPIEDICLPQGFESCGPRLPETFTLGGRSDSTYEYLPKQYLLLGGRLDQYKTMYLDSMKAVIDKLLFRPMTIDNRDILISGEVHSSYAFEAQNYTEAHIAKGEHLTCFAGGMLAMGGKLFDLPEHVEIGRKLTDGCVWAYNATDSGIMPEGFNMIACENTKSCRWNQTAWWQALDYSFDNREILREAWKKDYEVDDIEAYVKQKAIEDAAAEAEAEALAAKSAATAYNDDDEDTDDLLSTGTHSKRQIIDSTVRSGPVAIPPVPGSSSGASPTTATTTIADEDEDDEDADLDEYDSSFPPLPSPALPQRPIYTPAPPQTHEQYVLQRIEEERLPSGIISITGKMYLLRPEAIESVFYMYRITGEQYWRDMGWKMFQAVESLSRTKYGHSSLDDITKERPSPVDKMESFWIAETLKYFYLLFDEPDTWSLDDWVLNTEAHFFRRPENPLK